MRCMYCGARRPLAGNRCALCGGTLRPAVPALAVIGAEPAAVSLQGATVLHAGTPLRDRARGPAAVLQTLDSGDWVQVLGRSGKYTHVRAPSGVDGYVDSVQLDGPGPANVADVPDPEPVDQSEPARAVLHDDRAELPFGMVGLEGERIAYIGRFIYDPFNDRAFVVTSRRVIIGGGGAPLPRVVELPDIQSTRMREGSNGLAMGERTIVLQVAQLSGETYISGLRDPERALASLTTSMRELQEGAAEAGA